MELFQLCLIYAGIFSAALMIMDQARLALVLALVLSMLGIIVFSP